MLSAKVQAQNHPYQHKALLQFLLVLLDLFLKFRASFYFTQPRDIAVVEILLIVKQLPQEVGTFYRTADIFTPLIKYQHSEEPMGTMMFWLPILFAQLRGISFFPSLVFVAWGWKHYVPPGAVDTCFPEEQYYLYFQYFVIYCSQYKHLRESLQCPTLNISLQLFREKEH